jgi:hypothetical protein
VLIWPALGPDVRRPPRVTLGREADLETLAGRLAVETVVHGKPELSYRRTGPASSGCAVPEAKLQRRTSGVAGAPPAGGGQLTRAVRPANHRRVAPAEEPGEVTVGGVTAGATECAPLGPASDDAVQPGESRVQKGLAVRETSLGWMAWGSAPFRYAKSPLGFIEGCFVLDRGPRGRRGLRRFSDVARSTAVS